MDWRTFMIRWNNDHPLDRRYREKYNIAFNSPEHRRISQLDILLEFIEDQIFEEFKDKVQQEFDKKALYDKGVWIEERKLSKQDSEELFDKIDIFMLNNNEKSPES